MTRGLPPENMIAAAVTAARQSPCQSKRGVVIWDETGMLSVGWNTQVGPFICDGSDACKKTCGRTALHAEQMAIMSALMSTGRKLYGGRLLHVKIVDGKPVSGGGPSCLQCSKLILASGIEWVWLLVEGYGWKIYTAPEFHYQSGQAGDRMIFKSISG